MCIYLLTRRYIYICNAVYKKHHPPSLNDEVWRLEKIGKEGAFHRRLSKDRVFSVKDFLTLYFLDRSRLRNVRSNSMNTCLCGCGGIIDDIVSNISADPGAWYVC